MKRLGIMLATATFLALPVLAQTPPDDGAQPRRQRAPGGPNDGMRGGRMADRLAEELQLDADQRAQFDQIVAKFREESGGGEAQRGEAMRSMMEEMRSARQSGDQKRVKELRAQMEEMRAAGQGRMDRLYEQIQPILRPEQSEKLADIRERMEERASRMGGPGGPMGMDDRIDDLRESLNLDPKQQQRFDEVLADARSKGLLGGPSEDMRNLFQEMRQAEQDGNEDQARALRDKADSLRQARAEQIAAMFEELGRDLNEQQRATLTTFMDQTRGGGRAREGDDLRTMVRAARRIKLSTEQKSQLDEITNESNKAAAELRRDPQAQAQLSAKVKQEIEAILTPEQRTEFEKNMARNNRGAGGARREPRDEGGR